MSADKRDYLVFIEGFTQPATVTDAKDARQAATFMRERRFNGLHQRYVVTKVQLALTKEVIDPDLWK